MQIDEHSFDDLLEMAEFLDIYNVHIQLFLKFLFYRRQHIGSFIDFAARKDIFLSFLVIEHQKFIALLDDAISDMSKMIIGRFMIVPVVGSVDDLELHRNRRILLVLISFVDLGIG